MDLEYHGNYEIWGGDIDPAAVQIAREKCGKSGGRGDCPVFLADARAFSRKEPYGRIVSNPPYGERLMEKRKPRDCTEILAGQYRDCQLGGASTFSPLILNLSGPLGEQRTKKKKNYIMV